MGFYPSKYDSNFYLRSTKDGKGMNFLCCHVDNIAISDNNPFLIYK